jgi:hypothetical protein
MPALVLSNYYSRSKWTLEEIQDQVLGDLGLRNNNFVTSGDIERWANNAQDILARDTRAFHVTLTSGTTSGTSEYPIPNDVIGKALTIECVMYDGTPLPCVSQNWLDAHNRYWRTAPVGTPQYYYHRGFSVVGLYPNPDTTDEDILTVYVTALPPAVSEPEDLFYIPHGLDDAITTYCKLQASLKDAYGEGKGRIEYYKNEWMICQRKAMEIAASVNENEILRIGEQAAWGGGFDPFYTSSTTIATELP